MTEQSFRDLLARIVGLGAFLTTIMVAAWFTIEPVNAPKMVVLLVTVGAILGVLFLNPRLVLKINSRILIASLLFIFVAFLTMFTSNDSWEANFYGVSGRNTGLLTYAGLVVIFLSCCLLFDLKSINTVLKYFAFAGITNVIYCLLSILGFELLPWNNIYNTILGTFGNPNFIGAFLGIFGVVLLAYLLTPGRDIKYRLISFIIFIIVFIEIDKSNAIQGLVILGIGASFVLWFKLRSMTGSRGVELSYLISVSALGVVAVMGALQVGPLTRFIYKSSVSLRGEYWQAGWNMGMSHPFTGVGMDSYGSNFRRERDVQALISPGINTTTNAAHNVFLDIFSYGGFPLIFIYLIILTLITKSAIRILFISRSFDFIGVTLVAAWLCYLAQSLISINQIGLAVWGWIFGGLIIAYAKSLSPHKHEGMDLPRKNSSRQVITKKQSSEAAVSLASIIGLVLGLVISLPPVIADSKWKSALASGDGKQLEAAALQWPLDPIRMNEAVKIFSDNKWNDTARRLSELSIDRFSESYNTWYAYIQIVGLSEAEISRARSELHRLDPNNPEWK